MMPIGGVHGEVRIGDSMLMIGGGTAGRGFPSKLHPNALHVYVEDCRRAYAESDGGGCNVDG